MQVKGGEEEPIAGMDEMLVEVYPSMDETKVAEVFTEINKAEPCKLIDLPLVRDQNRVHRSKLGTSLIWEY